MTKLTTQKIIEIHDDIIDKYGGERGIRNEGTIDYLIFSLNKPNNVIKMAALALYCITANHPFMDGCKRTGFEIADLLIGPKVEKLSPAATFLGSALSFQSWHIGYFWGTHPKGKIRTF